MENKAIIGLVQERFGNSVLSVDETSDILTFTIESRIIQELLMFLKEDTSLQFNFLTTLCGIHYPGQQLPLGVVYHLHNLFQNIRIRIKTFLPAENPALRTITDIYAAAGWMERETYDFYGIVFEGHPNLKRILNVDYMDYFPMRKEYPLEDATREDKDDRFFGR